MNEQWFIVKYACSECTPNCDIIGPFNTEKEADDFNGKFGGTGKLWKGTCSSTHICKITSPDEIINSPKREYQW